MGQLFGTDGIRARAGEYPLDRDSVASLGRSLVRLLERHNLPATVLIGWDTRESSPWLARTVMGGIIAAGGKALCAGEIPTSAISLLTRAHRLSAGVVISASHNTYEDNGIKIFFQDGFKLSDAMEEELESMMAADRGAHQAVEEECQIDPSLAEEYLDFLKSNFASGQSFAGLSIVVDCANGASSALAPCLFQQLGFKVIAIHNQPSGRNINAGCGALHPETLAETVQAEGADLGVAYDGDADRAILVDEKSRILNGDYTLFIQARFLQERNLLRLPLVVATIMSNMGLEVALSRLGLKLLRTKVGDRYVLEEMLRRGANLGGERSGHTIFLDHCPTGDGLLTSLKMAVAMVETGKTLSELSRDLIEFPQLLLNVRVRRRMDFSLIPGFELLRRQLKENLGQWGRIEVRYSGTEPVARIMVEGENEDLVRQSAQEIAGLIQHHLGG